MHFFIFVLFTLQLVASTITLTDKDPLVDNFTLHYIYDKSRDLKIENIAKMNFDKNTSNYFTFGHKDGNTWFKFSITNKTKNNFLVLYLDEPLFKEFTLFYKDKNNYVYQESGLETALSSRAKEHIYPLFHLPIKHNETKTYYIKAYTKLAQVGAIKIATQKVFNSHKENLAFYLYSFYFGGLLIMLLLNIFLFIRVREKIYAYYVGYILSTALFVFVLSGICLLFGLAPWFYELQGSVPLMMIFLLLFSLELLDIKHYLPLAHKVLLGFIFIFTLLILLIIYDLKPWLEIMNYIATLALLTLIFVALKIGTKGNLNAKIYLPVMVIYVSSLALMSSVFAGDIQNTPFNRSLFLFVSYFELAFFSLLLANKIHRAKDLEKEHDILKELADKDVLSNLYNRRYFSRNATKMFHKAKEETKNLSILMIDIDNFKNINDTYGHEIGDKVIINISKVLLKHVRKNDIVARYGGEEFIFICQNIPQKRVLSLAQNICKSIEVVLTPISSKKTISVTVSIGVSVLLHNEDGTIEDVIRRADKALYKAKDQGKNRVICKTH